MSAVRIGWPAFIIPFLFVYSPTLLLRGEPLPTVFAVTTALAGIWLVSAAAVGYLRRRLGAGERALIAVTGLMLLIPGSMFIGAVWVNLVAVVSVIAIAVLGNTFRAQAAQ